MPEEQGTGFTFVDKRGDSDAAKPSADVEPSKEAEESPSAGKDRGRDTASPFQVPHLNATDRILMCVNWLHEGAWVALGLVHDPATEKIEQDLEGAKRLIDSIAYLVSKVDASLDEPTQRELRNLVRDLQLNFVQQQNRTSQPGNS
jgi:hypothetical protein